MDDKTGQKQIGRWLIAIFLAGGIWIAVPRAEAESLLSYVAADAELSFTDNGEDLAGRVMTGDWYYRVTAVDKDGCEGPPGAPSSVRYEVLN